MIVFFSYGRWFCLASNIYNKNQLSCIDWISKFLTSVVSIHESHCKTQDHKKKKCEIEINTCDYVLKILTFDHNQIQFGYGMSPLVNLIATRSKLWYWIRIIQQLHKSSSTLITIVVASVLIVVQFFLYSFQVNIFSLIRFFWVL